MRVVGSGLIARAFLSYDFGADVVIFASGVSNSRETELSAYRRESELLKGFLGKNNQVIYFSTCSISDDSLINTYYIKHKLEMEKLVLSDKSSRVIRLPQVVGKSKNKNTLINFLAWKIYQRETYTLQSGSVRNLIDVDDVVGMTEILLSSEWGEELVSFALPIFYETTSIVHSLENILNVKSKHSVVEMTPFYYPTSDFVKYVVDNSLLAIEDDYLERIVQKYYKNFPMGFS